MEVFKRREMSRGGGRDWKDCGLNSEGNGEPCRVCEQRKDMAGLRCSQAPSGSHWGSRFWGAHVEAGRPGGG